LSLSGIFMASSRWLASEPHLRDRVLADVPFLIRDEVYVRHILDAIEVVRGLALVRS